MYLLNSFLSHALHKLPHTKIYPRHFYIHAHEPIMIQHSAKTNHLKYGRCLLKE